jgi:hypothetical protein
MLIFHDKDALRCNRQVFTVLRMSGDAWLINLEVCAQVINFDHTQIIFFDNAAVCDRIPRYQDKKKTK